MSQDENEEELLRSVARVGLEVERALGAFSARGVRARRLDVAGAFHTEHMAPAVDALHLLAPGLPVADPNITLLSNRDGAVVTDGREYVARLVDQVSSPVRWDSSTFATAEPCAAPQSRNRSLIMAFTS